MSGDQPPPSGPGGMFVQSRSWDQWERGRRSWSGLRSRPRGGIRYNDLGCRRPVAEGGVWSDGVVVVAPIVDQDRASWSELKISTLSSSSRSLPLKLST